ncbi:glycosyltransferase family 4 protein [Nonomuraea roseoviolacea subsp. roseoviolacea]|uniref:glycosyltransferase family 4 protein n=1 Tax=Nonomuraea roseoviolacea TaxID=103837 RepID=UPI0031DC3F46
MKIAYVVTQFPPNISAGLGRYVEQMVPYLARDHRLAVFTLNDGRLPAHERDGAVTVHRPLGRLLGAISGGRRLNRTRRAEFLLLTATVVLSNWRYFALLRRAGPGGRPDLVAVHDATNFLCGLLCHYVLRLPVVYHVHTAEYGAARHRDVADPLGVFAGLERWLGRIARRVVVPTPDMREELAAAGWDRAAIEVVPLGGTFERVLADPAFDRRELRARAMDLRARLGIPATAPVLLFVGRLDRQKGVHQLLAAMPEIVRALPDLRLVLVGEGDLAGVRRTVEESGLRGHVLASGEFVGRDELLRHYEMADACVFPSLFEPFGLVATEAMALARPTILGDGFSRVFLGDPARPAARFVRAADPGDIAAGVIEVMTDPELRSALAGRGERFVRERLSWARAAGETLSVYQAAVRTSMGVSR